MMVKEIWKRVNIIQALVSEVVKNKGSLGVFIRQLVIVVDFQQAGI